ncbi:MAG: ABC transporter ATP-binding protein [Lachnospiraceae bacterium]|nr:ABC transporter ATP-binding protein [Lachnospiraceae bacterium]
MRTNKINMQEKSIKQKKKQELPKEQQKKRKVEEMKENKNVKTHEKQDAAEEHKPKYGMFSNVCYMCRQSWKYAKRVMVIVLAMAILGVTANVLQLFVVPVILEGIEARIPLEALVPRILLFMVGMLTVNASVTYIENNKMFGKVMIRLEILADINDKMNRTSFINTEKQEFIRMSQKASRTINNEEGATEAIWETLEALLKNFLGFVIYLFLLTRMNVMILIVTIATAVSGYFISEKVDRWVYGRKEEEAEHYHRLSYISGRARDRAQAKDVRIFDMSKWQLRLYGEELAKLQKFYNRRSKVYFGRDMSEVFFHFLRGGIAYGYLIFQVLAGNLSAAEFLLYFSAVSGFTTWVMEILSRLAVLHRQSVELSVVREFLEYDEPFTFEEGKPLTVEKGAKYEIELRGVSFRYPGTDRDILSNINLTLHPGEKLAIVGLNGAGKTTLIKLLCGFYDPIEGQVLLNGEDIRQFNRRDYYRYFSAVFQNFSLLAGSVTDNITQGRMSEPGKHISCAKRAGLLQKIEGLPQGFETHLNKEVYEDAVELSGGELQRLMLARALYKEGPIIVLDEPTSALDPLAEQDIYERYHELTKDASSVYISHRLASTRFCDRVILLADGGILEEGTHEQLLAAGGEYMRLFQIQSQYYQSEGKEGGAESGKEKNDLA